MIRYIFCWLSLLIAYSQLHWELELYFYSLCKDKLDFAYTLLCNKVFLLYDVLVLVTVGTLSYIWTHRKDRYFSIHQCSIVAFLLLTTYLSTEHWIYPSVFWDFDLSHFFLVLSFVLFLSFVIKIKKLNGISKREVFQSDERVEIDSNRKELAEIILQHFESTRSSESFAVGLVGSWGTGKTCFLHYLADSLIAKKQICYRFNVWNSKTPNNIIHDFFAGLSEKLTPYYSRLHKPMLNYSELLISLDCNKSVVYLFNLWQNKTVGKLRTEISQALTSLGRPVYILIDDIDRLTKEEVFEVLRLIRNTGNFPYLNYVVAYDKDYVENCLVDLNIPISYLNKIFSTELILPSLVERIESDLLIKTFNENVSNKKTEQLFSECVSKLGADVSVYFRDYRQVIRFAQEFSITVNFFMLSKNRLSHEINFSDLFYIEMLKFYNRKIYCMIKHTPDKVLSFCKDTYRMSYKWQFDKKNLISSQINLDEETCFILDNLFPTYLGPRKSSYSIAYIENFYKYFSYAIQEDKLSFLEFNELLNNTVSAESLEKKADMLNVKNERLASIFYHIYQKDPMNMGLNELKRYFDLILYVITKDNLFEYVIADKLNKNHIPEQLQESLSSYIDKQIHNYICNATHSMNVTCFLTQYVKEFKKSFYTGNNNLLGYTESQARSKILDNARVFLTKHKFNAADISNSKSELYTFVVASSICTTYDDSQDNQCYFENLVFETVLSYFSNHKSDKKDSFMKSLTPNIKFINPEEDDDEIARNSLLINTLFGSRKNYEHYLESCFY